MRNLLVIVGCVVVLAGAPAWGHREGKPPDLGPPTDKPGPTIPVERPVAGEGTVEASWAWWVGYAGYLDLGPFATEQACAMAVRRYPVRYRCVPVRD